MTNFTIRAAKIDDIAEIMALLQDDILGKRRETDNVELYVKGLEAIIDAENNEFYLGVCDHEIVGCFQLTFIPSLSRGASKRSLIESVRVETCHRGKKLGQQMMRWAIDHSRKNGCNLVQLTTDKQRDRAHKFYVDLGFKPSHIGMKLHI